MFSPYTRKMGSINKLTRIKVFIDLLRNMPVRNNINLQTSDDIDTETTKQNKPKLNHKEFYHRNNLLDMLSVSKIQTDKTSQDNIYKHNKQGK
jgi:hypothetical protein